MIDIKRLLALHADDRELETRPPREWNRCRFNPAAPDPHVESYFFKLNAPPSKKTTKAEALWIKATIYAPQIAPERAVAETWAIAFDPQSRHVATKDTVDLTEAVFPWHSPHLRVADLIIDQTRISGAVEGHGHCIELDLNLSFGDHGVQNRPMVPFFHPAMYTLPFPRTKLVTPRPTFRINGSYRVDGKRISVEGWPAMQGHNWGTAHAPSYAWCHCNHWHETQDLVFEGLTAHLSLGRWLSPPLTLICVRYKGKNHYFNTPLALVGNRGSIGRLRWRFQATGPQGEITGALESPPTDFVGLYYRNPDGSVIHCLNSKIARAEVELKLRGLSPVRATSNTAALEIGTRNTCHAVKMYV
jgi:hypothetical protein